MRVLITGGAGFIGSHLADELVVRGHEVRILDNLTEQVHQGKKPAWLNPQAEFVEADVRDRDRLSVAIREMDVVVHLAAAVGVAQSQYQVGHYFRVNGGGTANLADVLVGDRHKVKKVLLAGSMTAYGEGCAVCAKCGPVRPDIRNPDDVVDGVWEPHCPLCRRVTASIPTSERAQLRADNVYAVTKQTQEKVIQHISRQIGIPHVIFRLFNVFGPRQSLSNPYTGVAAIFISRFKAGVAPVIFEDGLQTRDFIHVDDVVGAFCDAVETDRADNAVINLGSGLPVTVQSLAMRIGRMMGRGIPAEITHQLRHGDVRHCTADITRAIERLDFEPRCSFDDALEQLIEWSLAQSASDRFDISLNELQSHQMLS